MSVDTRVLVLAPWGRDAPVICQVLDAGGLETLGVPTLAALLDEMIQGAGTAFITEEALTPLSLQRLLDWLDQQPPWSDFPLVVLAARHGHARAASPMQSIERLGNVVLLERPLHAESLVSAARSALRGRKRQYDLRGHLEAERRSQKTLETQREALLAAERVARVHAEHASRTKDEFLATLSHELRTPLAAIIGWAHVLRRSHASPDSVRAIDTIERNARTQAKLIDDLLDMSRIISGHVQLDLDRVDLAALSEAVLSSLEPSAIAKHLAVRLDTSRLSASAIVHGDAHRLQQVIWNLVSNAFKFTPPRGGVVLSLAHDGNDVTLTVADSGQGIAADFLPFVFDRFRQSDASTTRLHGGLGLGLSIVKNLLELHGGSVSAQSDGPGRGARFTLRLPAASSDMMDPPQPELQGQVNLPFTREHDLTGVCVVVVDDEPDLCELLQHELEGCGARVHAVGSAAEALQAVADHRPQLLISDVGMPDMDGHALIRQLRAREDTAEPLPAIALTAFAGPEDRVRALAAGFTAHIAKPVDPSQLIGQAAALLRVRDAASP